MPTQDVFDAVAFAAEKHQHQKRKNGRTPYISHVVRVCLVVRHVFGFDDPDMLTAAILHDTIEDVGVDRDDIDENFGPRVGAWVSALTKNAALPFHEREAEYCTRLAAADWQVKACKLADIYDNLRDVANFTPAGRRKNADKSRKYIDAMRPALPERLFPALALVEARLAELEAGLTS